MNKWETWYTHLTLIFCWTTEETPHYCSRAERVSRWIKRRHRKQRGGASTINQKSRQSVQSPEVKLLLHGHTPSAMGNGAKGLWLSIPQWQWFSIRIPHTLFLNKNNDFLERHQLFKTFFKNFLLLRKNYVDSKLSNKLCHLQLGSINCGHTWQTHPHKAKYPKPMITKTKMRPMLQVKSHMLSLGPWLSGSQKLRAVTNRTGSAAALTSS